MGDAAAQERQSRSQPRRERAGMRVHLGVRRAKPPLGSPLPADLPKGLASTIAVFTFRLTGLRTPYAPHTTAGSCSLCLLSECCLWPSSRRHGETREDAGCTSFPCFQGVRCDRVGSGDAEGSGGGGGGSYTKRAS